MVVVSVKVKMYTPPRSLPQSNHDNSEEVRSVSKVMKNMVQ